MKELGDLKKALENLIVEFPLDIGEIGQEHERTVEVYNLGSKSKFLKFWRDLVAFKEKFAVFRQSLEAKLEETINNLVPQKQYYDFEVERILRQVFAEDFAAEPKGSADKSFILVSRKQLQDHPEHNHVCEHCHAPTSASILIKELLLGSEDSLSPEEIKDIEVSEREIASGKCKTFETAEDLITDLHKKRKKGSEETK